MREIKFRAWDNVENKWLLGYEYKNLGGFSLFGEVVLLGGWSRVLDDYLFGRDGHSAEDLVVMQYTGLKDKNGKEIYEGDIVKTSESSVTTYEVIFTRGGFAINFKDGHRYLGQFSDLIAIGNIYENPELLRGE